jgi:hypothetical protein
MLKAAFKKTKQGWARFRVIIYTMQLVLCTTSCVSMYNSNILFHILVLHYYIKKNVVHNIFVLSMIGFRHGHDHMIVGFTTTYAISAYHH